MLELRFCTIISNDGITIFHRSFVEDELDEYLFSGFSSAMIAFSKELGDELNRIRMVKQTIFFREVQEEGSMIISVSDGYDVKDVDSKMDELFGRESLDLLLKGSRLGIVQNENERFERDLFEVFEIPSNHPFDKRGEEIFEDASYAPPLSTMDIPKSVRRKSLEEQLDEEKDIHKPLGSMFDDDEEFTSVLDALEGMN